MKRLKIIAYSLASLSLFAASQVSAQGRGLELPDRPTGLPGTSTATISSTLGLYINIFLGIVGIIAVGFIILGGFRYITSAGNDEAAEGGKKMITNAVIGLVVIILSYTIITVIINAVGKGNA